jgi:hypothetical protein
VLTAAARDGPVPKTRDLLLRQGHPRLEDREARPQRAAAVLPAPLVGLLASLQVLHRSETGSFEQLTYQNAEPQLNLIHPGGMFRGIVEHNTMRRIREKGGARGHRLENAALPLVAEVSHDPIVLGDFPYE